VVAEAHVDELQEALEFGVVNVGHVVFAVLQLVLLDGVFNRLADVAVHLGGAVVASALEDQRGAGGGKAGKKRNTKEGEKEGESVKERGRRKEGSRPRRIRRRRRI
jgi:hypothetical protein